MWTIAGWDPGQHATGWGRTSMLLDTVALDDDMSMYMVLAPGHPGGFPVPPQVRDETAQVHLLGKLL